MATLTTRTRDLWCRTG